MKKAKKNIKKTKKNIRQEIIDKYGDDNFLFMNPPEDFDRAIIGVMTSYGSNNLVIAYDYDKVIKANMKDGMTYDEAVEWFEYNQIGAYVGEYTPVFIMKE